MHSIQYTDYFDRLNSELNTWNGVHAIASHTLEKCSSDNITNEITVLDMIKDIAEVHIKRLRDEMQGIADCLAEGIETGLVVSPIVKENL